MSVPRITIEVPRTMLASDAVAMLIPIVESMFPNDAVNAHDYIKVKGFSVTDKRLLMGYRNAHITEFIADCCVIGYHASVVTTELWRAYQAYQSRVHNAEVYVTRRVFMNQIYLQANCLRGGAANSKTIGIGLLSTPLL